MKRIYKRYLTKMRVYIIRIKRSRLADLLKAAYRKYYLYPRIYRKNKSASDDNSGALCLLSAKTLEKSWGGC